MTAETHAGCADETGAGGQAQEVVNGLVRVGIVGLEGLGFVLAWCLLVWSAAGIADLFDLELVASVSVGDVVAQGLGADKVVV